LDIPGVEEMIVLFEFEGRDFVVRAKPFGKNGYHHGTVLYADPLNRPLPVVEQPPAPVVAPAPPEKGKKALPVPGRTIDDARRHPNIRNWDDRAKDFWLWLREHNKRSGLVSPLFGEFRKSRQEKGSPQLAFFVVAAGERLGMWEVIENKDRTRFSLKVMDLPPWNPSGSSSTTILSGGC
jgi:hypothetical protein